MSRKRYYGLQGAKKAARHKMNRMAVGVNSYSGGMGGPPEPRITGALLAANVFGAHGDDEWEDMSDCEAVETSSAMSEHLVEDGEHQLEFDMFNQQEVEEDLRQVIRRYNNALEKMGMAALQWHWLQEDVERFGQIEKMFKDMQLCRRLCGGGPPSDLDDYNERR